MNALILSCLVLSVIIVSVTCDEAECNVGDTKREDCNSCKCANGLWVCTKRACIQRKTRGTHCTPGTTFKKDCNTCVCNKDGSNAACTLRACL